MQRRKFMQFAGATAFALATGATVVTIDGCSINITDAINTVLNSAVAILKVAEPNASWTGLLASAIAALQQAETSWQSGGAAAIVVDALNTIEAVLAAVPETETYAPLIDILFAGIEAAINAFGQPAQLYAGWLDKRKAIVNSPHYGRATIRTSFTHPTWQGAYKAQWNAKAKAIGLPHAEI